MTCRQQARQGPNGAFYDVGGVEDGLRAVRGRWRCSGGVCGDGHADQPKDEQAGMGSNRRTRY
jgi:hypothetical protein